mmetsp:Transcript_79032/g.211197  ORF Transcript_79032/g.211197 Transcript_79032/m.211197 type:complete len:124 (+) Transcript_79032:209-580(+)
MALLSALRWADVEQWEERPCEDALFGFEYVVPEAIGCQSDCGASSVGDSVESRSSEGGYRCIHGQKICGHAAKCHCDAEQLRVYCHNAACREAKKEAQKDKRKRRSAARLPSWKRKQGAAAAA